MNPPFKPPLVAAGLLALVLGVWFAAGWREFCLDDAYIHLAYAKSLHLGQGLSYNPGDFETGFSSPLWVLLLALLPVDLEPHAIVKAAGIVLHVSSALLAGRLAGSLARDEFDAGEDAAVWASGVAGCGVAASPGLLQAAVSGMEVSLACLLCLVCVWTLLRDRPGAGIAAGGLATLARPECLVFVVALAIPAILLRRRLRAATAVAGALVAFGGWCVYNLAVSGYPLPNTYYVKTSFQFADSVRFVLLRVFGASAWVLGLAGVLLAALALLRGFARRAAGTLGLGLAWVAAVVSTALSRSLQPDVLFFHQRYFLVFAALPWILVGTGLACSSRRWWRLALLPTVAVLVWQLPAARARTLDQETDILNNHVRVGRHVAAELPADATLMVEGAGAIRYHAPRGMRVVDFLGLNDREIAHARGDASRLACLYVDRAPTHVAFPDEFTRTFGGLFVGEVVEEFLEPHYAQLVTARPRAVYLAEVSGPLPHVARQCGQGR